MKRISVLIGAAMVAMLVYGCGEAGEASSTSPAGNAVTEGKTATDKPAGGGVATAPPPEPPPK
jgi:PBP1b-binding outer membrane lipoprotein LpoB